MKARIRRLQRQRLSTQVVIMMVAILAVTMAAGFFVVQWNLIRQLDRKSQQVEIEARVVAANRSFARDIGTQLAFAAQALWIH